MRIRGQGSVLRRKCVLLCETRSMSLRGRRMRAKRQNCRIGRKKLFEGHQLARSAFPLAARGMRALPNPGGCNANTQTAAPVLCTNSAGISRTQLDVPPSSNCQAVGCSALLQTKLGGKPAAAVMRVPLLLVLHNHSRADGWRLVCDCFAHHCCRIPGAHTLQARLAPAAATAGG